MKKRKNKLGWFVRWWYSHLTFPAQYVSFKDSGEEELFWNIVTWHHFFNHYKDFECKIQWYISKEIVACIYIRNLKDLSTKAIYFNNKPCELIQVTNGLASYKQVDGNIYKIIYDSSVE